MASVRFSSCNLTTET